MNQIDEEWTCSSTATPFDLVVRVGFLHRDQGVRRDWRTEVALYKIPCFLHKAVVTTMVTNQQLHAALVARIAEFLGRLETVRDRLFHQNVDPGLGKEGPNFKVRLVRSSNEDRVEVVAKKVPVVSLERDVQRDGKNFAGIVQTRNGDQINRWVLCCKLDVKFADSTGTDDGQPGLLWCGAKQMSTCSERDVEILERCRGRAGLGSDQVNDL